MAQKICNNFKVEILFFWSFNLCLKICYISKYYLLQKNLRPRSQISCNDRTGEVNSGALAREARLRSTMGK